MFFIFSCRNAPCCNPPRYRCPGRFGRWKHFLPCIAPLQSSACGSGSRFSHWRARSTWPRWSSDLSKISADTPWCTAWSSLRHPDSPGPEHAPGLPESEGGYPPKWSLFLPHRPYRMSLFMFRPVALTAGENRRGHCGHQYNNQREYQQVPLSHCCTPFSLLSYTFTKSRTYLPYSTMKARAFK